MGSDVQAAIIIIAIICWPSQAQLHSRAKPGQLSPPHCHHLGLGFITIIVITTIIIVIIIVECRNALF